MNNEPQSFQNTHTHPISDHLLPDLGKSTSNLSEDAFFAELKMGSHNHGIPTMTNSGAIDEDTAPGQQQQHFDPQDTSAQGWDQGFTDPFTFDMGDMDVLHDFQDGGGMDLFGNWAFGGGFGTETGAFGEMEE